MKCHEKDCTNHAIDYHLYCRTHNHKNKCYGGLTEKQILFNDSEGLSLILLPLDAILNGKKT